MDDFDVDEFARRFAQRLTTTLAADLRAKESVIDVTDPKDRYPIKGEVKAKASKR